MLALDGHIVQREEHFARLARSARELNLPPPDDRAFLAFTPNPDECAVRCVYDGVLSFSSGAIPPRTMRRRKGARVITLDRKIVRAQPQHKLTSYAEWLREQTLDTDEGLFVDRRGHILEGLTTNVFALAGDALITARDRILPGIVRAWVLANASRAGLRLIERRPTIDELQRGSFLTSSLTLLAPIVQLDGVACTRPGPAFATLRRLYLREIARSSRPVLRVAP